MPNGTLSSFPTPEPPAEFYASLPDAHATLSATETLIGVLPTLPPPPRAVQLVEASPHHEYWCSKLFYRDEGMSVRPVMGPPGTPASVTRERAPYGYLVVRWGAKRIEVPPTIPSSDLQDPNAVLMSSWVSAAVPGHLGDGSQAWCLAGAYLYALRVPYKEGDTLTLAAMPFVEETVSENTLTAASYSRNIIGPNTPPVGAPTNPITF
jgi:hypothetical protein